jgi:general secretion pathway protein E
MEPDATEEPVLPLVPSTRFLETVPHEVARRHLIFGHAERNGLMLVRHAPGVPAWAIENVARWCGVPVCSEQFDPELIAREIDVAYSRYAALRQPPDGRSDDDSPRITLGPGDADYADLEADLARAAAGADADLLNTDQKGPVVRLVDALLFEAIGQGARDIHVQPLASEVLIRYRIDGVLATARTVPVRLGPAIVTRIKVMARMDVAERRTPQDGRATVAIGGNRGRDPAKTIDLRISTLPTAFGERVVIRMLYAEQSSTRASIASLSMPPDVEAAFLDRAGRTSGIVLVTGPTGSGKTTTLYATLRWIIGRSATGGTADRIADVNVMTIEDPIEYDLSAADAAVGGSVSTSGGLPRPSLPISQTQVDTKKGLTFASGLRHILRQDPDVIMVGEIRDGETARIAIQASLTGHMVFSTLHTNDAPSAISRLIDLEVEPFLICSTLSAVLAQRLVRLLHAECAGRGCTSCLGTGYRGRRGLFELLLMDDAVRALIARGASSTEIRQSVLRRGTRSLSDEGVRLVQAGITTSAEVQRVTLGVD